MMDDLSALQVLKAIAPSLRRSVILPELKANLTLEGRKEALSMFASPDFKKSACVIMGEPDEAYRQKVQSLIFADKQAKANEEQKKKALEEARQKQVEKRKKLAEAAKKAKELAQKKKEGKEVE